MTPKTAFDGIRIGLSSRSAKEFMTETACKYYGQDIVVGFWCVMGR